MSGSAATTRLDKWLWRARFFKTRGLAARAIVSGSVRVNTVRVVKPATPVAVGDGLTFVQQGRVRVVRVCGLGLRRGPSAEAQLLYQELVEGSASGDAEPTRAGA